jgi:hypothetical protein
MHARKCEPSIEVIGLSGGFTRGSGCSVWLVSDRRTNVTPGVGNAIGARIK